MPDLIHVIGGQAVAAQTTPFSTVRVHEYEAAPDIANRDTAVEFYTQATTVYLGD